MDGSLFLVGKTFLTESDFRFSLRLFAAHTKLQTTTRTAVVTDKETTTRNGFRARFVVEAAQGEEDKELATVDFSRF